MTKVIGLVNRSFLKDTEVEYQIQEWASMTGTKRNTRQFLIGYALHIMAKKDSGKY
jgi:hypothetical protein